MKTILITMMLVFGLCDNAQKKVADLKYIVRRDFSTVYYTVENNDTIYYLQFKALHENRALMKFKNLSSLKDALLTMYKLNKRNEVYSLGNLSENRVMYSGNAFVVVSSREGGIDYFVSRRYIRKMMERLGVDYRLYDPKGSYEDGMYN